MILSNLLEVLHRLAVRPILPPHPDSAHQPPPLPPFGHPLPLRGGEGWGEGAARRFKGARRDRRSGTSLPDSLPTPPSWGEGIAAGLVGVSRCARETVGSHPGWRLSGHPARCVALAAGMPPGPAGETAALLFVAEPTAVNQQALPGEQGKSGP